MEDSDRRLFLVKVRVSLPEMGRFAQKLQKGELDRSAIRMTYCLRDDPAFGLGIWEVGSDEELERKLGPWREFYASVEVQRVVTPAEAMALLSERQQESGESR